MTSLKAPIPLAAIHFRGSPWAAPVPCGTRVRERLSVGLFKSGFVRGMLGKQRYQGNSNQNPEGSRQHVTFEHQKPRDWEPICPDATTAALSPLGELDFTVGLHS